MRRMCFYMQTDGSKSFLNVCPYHYSVLLFYFTIYSAKRRGVFPSKTLKKKKKKNRHMGRIQTFFFVVEGKTHFMAELYKTDFDI